MSVCMSPLCWPLFHWFKVFLMCSGLTYPVSTLIIPHHPSRALSILLSGICAVGDLGQRMHKHL